MDLRVLHKDLLIEVISELPFKSVKNLRLLIEFKKFFKGYIFSCLMLMERTKE